MGENPRKTFLFKEKLVLASGSISADRDSFCSSCFLTPRSCPSGKNRYPVTDQGRHIKPWFGSNMWWLMAHFNSRVLLQGQLWLSDQLDLAAQVLALLSSVPYLQGGSQGHSLTNTLHTTLLSHFLEPQQGVKNHIMTLEDLISHSRHKRSTTALLGTFTFAKILFPHAVKM